MFRWLHRCEIYRLLEPESLSISRKYGPWTHSEIKAWRSGGLEKLRLKMGMQPSFAHSLGPAATPSESQAANPRGTMRLSTDPAEEYSRSTTSGFRGLPSGDSTTGRTGRQRKT